MPHLQNMRSPHANARGTGWEVVTSRGSLQREGEELEGFTVADPDFVGCRKSFGGWT